jgi:hypothetical protein
MNVTSWKAKNNKPGMARIHRPWDAVVTVKAAASGKSTNAVRLRA